MAVVWKMKPKEVLFDWLRQLDNPAVKDQLTDWEKEFSTDIGWQLNKYGKISEKQQSILERIYSEKTK